MKKILLVIVSLLMVAGTAYATSTSAVTSTSVVVGQKFAVEFYSDANIRYPNGQITFPNIDPASEETMIFTTQYAENDGKSDVGVLVLTNVGADWSLTISVGNIGATSNLLPTNVAVYLPDVVYIRNEETTASTGLTKAWAAMPDAGQLIYTGSGGYQNTTPFGVLATFGFAIMPTGQANPGGGVIGYPNALEQGTHTFDILYTLTNAL